MCQISAGRPHVPWRLWLLAIGLACIGAVYTTAGAYRLVADVPGSFPIDLRLRWMEGRLVVQHRNPQVEGHPDPELPSSHKIMRTAGGSYPSWAYGLGLILVPPLEWHATRWYFAGLYLASLGALSAFAYARLRAHGRLYALISALLPFATFPTAICASFGQYAVVVSALQVGAVVLLEAGRGWGAGVLLGIGLVKPQLTALFCLGLVVHRKVPAIVGVIVVLVVATLSAAALMGVDAMGLTVGSGREAFGYAKASHNPVLILFSGLVGHQVAVPLLAAFGAVVFAAAAARIGDRDWLAVASLAAILTMYWSYRKHFDVALMTLPVIWLWHQYSQTRQPTDLAPFLAVGLTVWLPFRDSLWDHSAVQFTHLIIWAWAALKIARPSASRTTMLGVSR